MNNTPTATELEFLQWYYINTDFGPADEDVRQHLKSEFTAETGKLLPDGYGSEE